MRRRDFIALIGGATGAWPLVVRAQQSAIRRVGIFVPFLENDSEVRKSVVAFVQGLRELGWIEGGNIRFDYRWAGADSTRIRTGAAELVEMQPDAILAMTPLTLAPLQQLTSSIPIVFVQITDPVGSGFVPSLARPGGNITGFTTAEFATSGKMLEALKKVAPEVNHVVVIYYPVQSPQIGRLAAIQTAAAALSVQVSPVSVGNADQIKDGIEGIDNETRKGVVVLPNPITIANRDLIIALLARHRLPAVYDGALFVRAGGLVSYGIDPVIQWQQAASYVDRILKGAKPADLPVQQATKFELTINLKTAKALGLTVPQSLLAQADEVIE